MSDVELSVRSQLRRIIEELDQIAGKASEVNLNLKEVGANTEEGIRKPLKQTETFLNRLRGLSGRVASQMKDDFKALASVNALSASLKLSEQFRGSIKEAASLSDTVRKLGGVFGITRGEFTKLQTGMVRGMGDIGLSSEAAARAIEGLAASGAPVKGQEALVGYGRAAGQLASISKSEGSEGDIARLIAQVIQARGGNVNDTRAIGAISEDIRRVFNATGAKPTETLNAMKGLFTSMSKDMRATVGSRGLASLAATASVAGPNSTKFLEEFLGKSPIARAALEAQGFKGIVGKEGLDVEKFRAASKSVLARVGGDPRLAAQTLGLSEDAAEGFVRLSESLDRVKAAQDNVQKATGDLTGQYQASMGFAESFRASINRVKSIFAEPLSGIMQGGSDLLSSASQSDLGAAGVVAGGGALAALLAGGGLRGVGKAALGGVARGAAAEAMTGQKTIPVYVVNASEIGGGGAGAAAAAAGRGKLAGFLGKAGMVGMAGVAGYEIGGLISEQIDKRTQGSTEEGFDGNLVERLFFKLDKLLGGQSSANVQKAQKVMVELNKRDLKESRQPTRGASY